MPDQPICFIRLPEVRRRTGLSTMSIWRGEKAGTFPLHCEIGPHSIAWVEAEIERFLQAKIEERDAKQNRQTALHRQAVEQEP